MWLWIFIWVLLLSFSFLKRTNKPLLWACAIILSLLAGMRGLTMGRDTELYFDIFNIIADGVWPTYLEPSWILLNKLISSIGLEYNWFLWLVSILTLYPVIRMALKESSNPHLSLFIYYSMYAYLNSYNGMRQFLAISIVLWAFCLLYRGKITKFIAVVLLASTVHYSSLVALLALLFRKVKLNDWLVWLCVVGSWLAGQTIVNDAMLAPFVGKYVCYLDELRDNIIIATILSALMSGLFIIIYYTSINEFRNNYWLKLFFISIVLSNLTIEMVQGARIIIFFTITQLIMYPLYFSYKKKEAGFMMFFIIVYMFVLFMKILLLGNHGEYSVFPYHFWIDN